MIKFNPDKLTFEYVYVRKIFKTFIEVISDSDRGKYESNVVEYKRLKDGAVQIPIHYRVYSLYLKTNSTLHFDETKGKKACITYYDGKVLSIDVHRKSYFIETEKEETWKSVNEGVFAHVKNMLTVQENIYIDGESIFLTDKLGQKEYFAGNKSFWIQPVRFISLSKMGVKKTSSKMLMDRDKVKKIEEGNVTGSTTQDSEDNKQVNTVSKEDNNSIVVLKSGFVLAYNPNADIDPNDESIIVYSPVFTEEQNSSKNKFDNPYKINEKNAFFRNLKDIENKENPTVLNLNFVLKATKIIGEHYSFEDTEFLGVPKIIMETGIINLKSDISLSSRSIYPVDIPVWDGMAYIMRYCYMESDLNVYRDLVSLFRFTLVKGFVSKKKTGDLFLEGKNMGDIKHFKINLSNGSKKEEKSSQTV